MPVTGTAQNMFLLYSTYGISARCKWQEHSAHLREVHEMLEARIEVCFLPQGTNVLEVGVVDVSIDPEQPLEYAVNDVFEVGWKRLAVVLGKEARIIHLTRFSMQHQVFHTLITRQFFCLKLKCFWKDMTLDRACCK